MAKPTPPVKIRTGTLSGTYDKRGEIAIFKGIPYARPPVGLLRWKPPQPAVPWSGTLKAEKAGPAAIQMQTDGAQEFFDLYLGGQGWSGLKTVVMKLMMRLAPSPKESEDCLTLTVRTPSLDKEAKLPVMVWIHGGDHQIGSGNDPFYDSNALSRRGVVTVYINYRLGLIGYFAHPELSRESEHGVSGNYGTLDQIAALRWVQENISAFGGDPDNVTIFGESAGGESVAHMLTSPLARGFFHKAIMQSPADGYRMLFLHHPFLGNPAGEALGRQFADRFAPGGAGQVDALRQIAPGPLNRLIKEEEVFQRFYPFIDGYVLPKSPLEAFLDGDQARVPILLGSNADEGSLFYPLLHAPVGGHYDVPAHEVAGLIHEVYGDQAAALLDLYPGLRQGEAPAQTDFLSDSFWGAFDYFYAVYAARVGQPVYRYHFTRTPPSPKQTLGAYHMAEIPFVHDKPMPFFDFTEEDRALAQAMGDYWVQFARSGDPNLAGHPQWPQFTTDNPQQMRLGLEAELGATAVDRQAKLELFRRHLLRRVEEMKQLREAGPMPVQPATQADTRQPEGIGTAPR